jgi:hypothetical protein
LQERAGTAAGITTDTGKHRTWFIFNRSQNHYSEYTEKDTCYKKARINKK